MKYMEMDDQFKYGLTCKLNWGHYIKYVVEILPIILTDLINRSEEDKKAFPNKDGYYVFKRYESEDENKVMLYRLWCVNLDYPRLRPSDIYYLEEKTEILNTVWQVYMLKDTMDSSDPNGHKPCVFKFLPGNEVLKFKDQNDL